MFGHDDNQNEEDKDVHINDELLQPDDQSDDQQSEHADSDSHDSDNSGAVEVTPSAPAVDGDNSDAPSEDKSTTVEPTEPVSEVSSQLMDIKQQALQSLSPLLGHLDQTPEEKFRTTMMLIQASDNQDLIKIAFESAQAMSDDKERAQALLDIVNEINYFTTKQAN
jgi:hypothetical protein